MKKNWKLIIINVLIGIIISTVGIVTAQTIINSSEVTYDNSKSNGSFSNVQNSLDELYNRAGYTGEEYHEEILHGADPVLSGELVPVYLADNGDVYYANTHTKWYSYEYKKWANAVILVDDAYAKNREDKKDKYSVGDKISEEDIESYFVWIPRYAYKLWDLGKYEKAEEITFSNTNYATSPSNIYGNARIIDITFGTNSYLSGDTYKKLIRNSETGEFSEPTGLAIDNWLVHPAFTLGDIELNGFWIGKFETGYNQTNNGEIAITGTNNWSTTGAEVNSALSNKIVIKPNVNSWRLMTVSNMFNTAKGYNADLKSHMLKNTEWGAVAYLSYSLYGKGGLINNNNTSDYKTGYSALNAKGKGVAAGNGPSSGSLNASYNTAAGYLASTTGNITGVYDIVGGAWEYVAATTVSNREADRSGFEPETVATEMKAGYIDAYPADCSTTNFSKRILGDATGETGPFYWYYDADGAYRYHNSWNGNISEFIAQESWFTRGGGFTDGILASSFYFGMGNGLGFTARGFHLALAPSN